MPVVDTDIVMYASANKPVDDTSTNGGAIDAQERVVFTDLAANDSVEIISSNAGDTTQTATLDARKADGSFVSQTVTLNGTTAVTFATLGTIERVERLRISANAAGTVTLRRSDHTTAVGAIPPGERGFRRLFINAASDPSNPKPYYEKIFIKNTHATLAALNCTVAQNADPTGKVTHLIAAAVDDTNTSTNRLTAPATSATLDPDTFDDTAKTVPGNNLAAGSAIGVWLKLSLSTGDAPIKSSYSPQLSFTSA